METAEDKVPQTPPGTDEAKAEAVNKADSASGERRLIFPKKNSQYCGTGRLPCPDLGEDWHFEQIVRQQGKSAGNYDTYYFSPNGTKIRSKLKLQQFVGKDLKEFDFNAGEFVKKAKEVPEAGLGASRAKNKRLSLKQNHIKTVQPSVISGERKKIKKEWKAQPRSSPGRRKKGSSLVCRFPPRRRKLKKRITGHDRDTETTSDVTSGEAENVSPYDLFRRQAIPHAELLLEDASEAEDLVRCAWDCLSDDSKRRYHGPLDHGLDVTSYYNTGMPETLETSTESQGTSSGVGLFSPDTDDSPKQHKLSFSNTPHAPKRRRCGMCTGCTARNCGVCIHCRDMKKFGGTGSKKQSCVRRRCEAIHSPNGRPVDVFFRSPFAQNSPPFLNNPANYEGSLYWGNEVQGRELSRLGRLNPRYGRDVSSNACFPYPNSSLENISNMVSALGPGDADDAGSSGFPVTRFRSRSQELSPRGVDNTRPPEAVAMNADHLLSDNVPIMHRPHRRKSRAPMYIKQDSVVQENKNNKTSES